MAAFIIGAEVAFWVLLALGLLVRYVLKWRRTSVVVLLLVPLVDVVLLGVSVYDLHAGATADPTHGLAALYLGFSVVFGHSMIRWADQRVAYRWAGGPPPVKPPKYGMGRAKHEWLLALRTSVAWALSLGVAYVMMWLVGAPERTDPLVNLVMAASKLPMLMGLIALTYTIWPKKGKQPKNSADVATVGRSREG